MRIFFIILAFTSCITAHGQTAIPVMGMPVTSFNRTQLMTDSQSQKKWSVSTYAGMGMGIGFFNGGNFAFSGTQIGLQINRRLNNNLYAFAGAGITPMYFNFNRSISNTDPSKNYMFNPALNGNGWGLNPGIQAGLMYVNDAKTFSISGSIGVSSYSNPFYPGINSNTQQQTRIGSRQ